MRDRCVQVLVLGAGLWLAVPAAAQEEPIGAAVAEVVSEPEGTTTDAAATLAPEPMTGTSDAVPPEEASAAVGPEASASDTVRPEASTSVALGTEASTSDRAQDAAGTTSEAVGEASRPAGDGAGAEEAAEAQESGLPDWLRGFSLMAFVDGYAQGVWTLADPFSGDRSDILGHRAFDTEAGLTLSFVGIDIAYRYETVGARLDLRFGTSVPRLLGPTSGLPDGMQFLKQAFVHWRPVENLQIDFGQFDTIYGAEVSESWRNHTYSRGSVYNVVQPFYHTGFRVAWTPVQSLTITGIAVNGWNNVVDDNDGKTFGLQASWSSDHVRVTGGYLGGPEGERDDLWRHLGDLVVTLRLDQLEIIANGDYVAEQLEDGSFDQLFGVMLSGRLQFPPLFAVALRGEIVGDPDDDTQLYTGTLTLELTPVEHLVIRLDNRVEGSSDPRFQDTNGLPSQTVVSSILGVVVHSD